MSLARSVSLTLTILSSGALAGCQTTVDSAESHAAQALDAGEADAPDAPVPTPVETCADELAALLAGPYADVCGWEDLSSSCRIFDIPLEDILAELGLLTACDEGELCCHGACVSYEDAEAHGC